MSDAPVDTTAAARSFEPVTLSIDEAAEILRINRKTVVAMIERGELPSVRYARRRWIPVRAVRDLLMLDIPSRVVTADHG